MRTKHTRDSLIATLQQFYVEHNRVPRAHETTNLPNFPRYKVFEYHFGSWKNAIESAKLAIPPKIDTNHYTACCCCDAPLIIQNNVYDKSLSKHFFCTLSCAARYNNKNRILTDETKQKIRETLSKTRPRNPPTPRHNWKDDVCGPYTRVFLCTCKYTGIVFYSDTTKLIHPSAYETFNHYKYLCKFKFTLSHFPGWFDLSLLKEHKMYKASNRGNNLTGISRDHMISISDGYRLGIDPSIISHPANCNLIPHPANQRKNTKSSIAIEDLNQRIQAFDSMYPNWREV